jgi:hypothetical protein
MERAIVRIALNHALNPRSLNPASKCQHIASLRTHHQVLHIDRALHSTRLIRPFEVAFDRSSLLLQLKVLRRSRSVWILAIQSPLARNIRRLLLWRRLLRQGDRSRQKHQTNPKYKKLPVESLHAILHRQVNDVEKSTAISQLFHPFPRRKIKFSSIQTQTRHG